MENVLFVEAVVVASFLIAMHRIVGRIEVQEDPLGGGSAADLLAPLLDVQLPEGSGYAQAGFSIGAFSSRERVGWLARSASVSGKRPHTNFSKGSARRAWASF